MSLQGRKLAALVAAAPGQPGFRHGLETARAAAALGVDVYLYAIDEAVRGVDELAGTGAKLFACADSAQRRGLQMDPKATYAGLALLSQLIAASDRFVAFT